MTSKMKFVWIIVFFFILTGCISFFGDDKHPTIIYTITPSASVIPSATPSPTSTQTPTTTPTPTPTLLPSLTPAPIVRSSNVISVENVTSLDQIGLLSRGEIRDIELSPDNQFIALASITGVYVYELNTKSYVEHIDLDGKITTTPEISYSPDNKFLAIITDKLLLLDTQTKEIVKEIEWKNLGLSILALQFSPDTKYIAIGVCTEISFGRCQTASLHMYDMETERMNRLDNTKVITSLRFSKDLRFMATGYIDGTIVLWSPLDFSIITTLEGHFADVLDLEFKEESNQLISAGSDYDRTIRVWDLSTVEMIQEFRLLGMRTIISINITSDGAYVAVSSDYNETLQLFHLQEGDLTQIDLTTEAIGPTRDITLSEDGKFLVWVSIESRLVGLLDIENNKVLTRFEWPGVVSTINLLFSPDGSSLISNSWIWSEHIISWNFLSYQENFSRLWGDCISREVAFSEDGKTIVVASCRDRDGRVIDGGRIRYLDASTGATIHTVDIDGDLVSGAFSPDLTLFARVSANSGICLWRLSDVTFLGWFHPFNSLIGRITFSPDGKIIASTHQDGGVGLWNVSTMRLISTFSGHDEYSVGLRFSPDGRNLATSGGDGTVKIWRVADGALLCNLEGYTRSIDFSPDGNILVAGYDTFRFYQVSNCELLHQIDTRGIDAIIFSPDGKYLVSGGVFGDIRVWGIP